MWRKVLWVLALILLLGGCQPSAAQQAGAQSVYCGRSFTVSAGATSITAAVTANADQFMAICGYTLNAGAATATFQLTVGTGTNCNANTVQITPPYQLGINGVLVDRQVTAFYSTPKGYQLCYTITGTGPIEALVTYHLYQ